MSNISARGRHPLRLSLYYLALFALLFAALLMLERNGPTSIGAPTLSAQHSNSEKKSEPAAKKDEKGGEKGDEHCDDGQNDKQQDSDQSGNCDISEG